MPCGFWFLPGSSTHCLKTEHWLWYRRQNETEETEPRQLNRHSLMRRLVTECSQTLLPSQPDDGRSVAGWHRAPTGPSRSWPLPAGAPPQPLPAPLPVLPSPVPGDVGSCQPHDCLGRPRSVDWSSRGSHLVTTTFLLFLNLSPVPVLQFQVLTVYHYLFTTIPVHQRQYKCKRH